MKALIVDDQREIVTGLLQGLPWSDMGIETVYGAYSAEDAREKVVTDQIDILLCDIEMPQESGLEFVQWFRDHGYGGECIFLTSHAEFEYARWAVKLGSFEYILKPARYSEIEQVIRNAVRHRFERKKMEILQNAEDYQNQMADQMADYYFRMLENGTEDGEELLDKIIRIKLQQDWKGQECHVVYLDVFRWIAAEPRWKDSVLRVSLTHIWEELLSPYQQQVILLQTYADKFWLLLIGREALASDEEYRTILLQYADYETSYLPFRSAVYYGGSVNEKGPLEIICGLKEQARRNVTGSTGFISPASDEPSRIRKVLINTSSWIQLLVQGKGEVIAETIEHYFQDPRNQNRTDSLRFIQNAYIQAVFCALAEMKLSPDEVFDDSFPVEELSSQARDSIRLLQVVRETAGRMKKPEKEDEQSDSRRRIRMVQQYIHDNMDQRITRSEIAEYLHLNEDYLSRMFKKETGYMIKEYIDREKINAAKELLRATELSVSMVALKTGFHNFAHFSQTFRKYEGISPSEYRGKRTDLWSDS